MSHFSFKQFNEFVEAPLEEEQLDEIFGIFKSKEEKEKAERKKLELLAARGSEIAKMKLRDMRLDAERAEAAKKAADASKEIAWKTKQAEIEASERGSSRAFDRETGSAKRNVAPRWNAAKGQWEKWDGTKWVATGDTDRYSDVTHKRGAQ